MNVFELLTTLTRDYGLALALSMARPLALTITGAIFLFGTVNSAIVKAALAIALSIPVVSQAVVIFAEYQPLAPVDIITIAFKETILGLLLGLVTSIPIIAFSAAGYFIDSYRLESPSLVDPLGGQTTVHAQVFGVLAAWTFAATGGMWILADLLYTSYEVWPLNEFVPFRQQDAFNALGNILVKTMSLGLMLAAPLILLMFLNDFAFMIAARIMKRLDSYAFAIPVRNIILVLTMPIYISVVSGIAQDQTLQLKSLGAYMKSFVEVAP
jgi:type III secretion protein T